MNEPAPTTRFRWQILLGTIDVAAIVLVTVVTYSARFEGVIPLEYYRWMSWMLLASCIVYIGYSLMFGLYRVVLRYVGIDTLVRTILAVASGAVTLAVGDVVIGMLRGGLRIVPLGVVLIQAVFVLVALAGIRITVRTGQHLRAQNRHLGERVVIVGAGSAGSLLLRELQTRLDLNVDIVGFVDDNARLYHSIIGGVPVLGPIGRLEEIVADNHINQLFIALPTADDEYVRSVLNRAADMGLTTRIMPKIVVERGSVDLSDLRQVNVEDLLGRELTPIDMEQVGATLEGKTVAVTGAAGSIGSELCRQIVMMNPSRLLLLEIDESRLYELWFELESLAAGIAEMHILDIRDKQKVDKIFSQFRPDVVLHAAAYKHVPLMELEPSEAVRTNVYGTHNILEAAGACGAERFVLISTDKAVNPVNVMGKTKQISERLLLSTARTYPEMMCVAVRFGNVLGSRGSVVPIFEEKLARGEDLTVTDPEVTRFFMVIPEAARLVLQAQAIGESGDIFVLEMGEPVKIVDLAHKMIALSGIPADVVFTGLRPGEKLHEILHTGDEKLEPTTCEKIDRVTCSSVTPFPKAEFEALSEAAFAGTLTASEVVGG